MTSRWRAGFQFVLPGSPITAAWSGSAPRRLRGAYVSPERDELPGGVGVVGECRNVQCGVARVQLSVTFGDEVLVAVGQPSASRPRCRSQCCRRVDLIARRDEEKQPDELRVVLHDAG